VACHQIRALQSQPFLSQLASVPHIVDAPRIPRERAAHDGPADVRRRPRASRRVVSIGACPHKDKLHPPDHGHPNASSPPKKKQVHNHHNHHHGKNKNSIGGIGVVVGVRQGGIAGMASSTFQTLGARHVIETPYAPSSLESNGIL